MPIKALNENVWSKIAAGEVVERPASVVKELVENSLDAGAKRIKINLYDGGRLRIIVEDDGSGIPFEELPLALMYHATSKISEVEDLDNIKTLGYRGEALASVAAVAEIEIRSRSKNSERGGMIRASENKILEHVEINHPQGTRIQVENLFSGLPARRKFLKSAAGELRRAAAFIREYAVCNPDVAFYLAHDGKEIFSTDGQGSKRRVLLKIWGQGADIQNINLEQGNLKLECWFQARSALSGRNDIIGFVNGRAVNDPVIKAAVAQSSRDLSGNWALFFSLAPSLVDVNIHPAKSEVRFRYPDEIFKAVRNAANNLGSPMPFTPSWRTPPTTASRPSCLEDNPTTASWPSCLEDNPLASKLALSPLTGGARSPSIPATSLASHERGGAERSEAEGLSLKKNFFSNKPIAPSWPPSPSQGAQESEILRLEEEEKEAEAKPEFFAVESNEPQVIFLGQNSGGYLVYDNYEGLVLVDPHAAHERINYEKIKRRVENSTNVQKIIPIILPPTLAIEASEFENELKANGFELENTPSGIKLNSVPALDAVEFAPEVLLRASLNALKKNHDGDIKKFLWRTWATMACKASVKLTTKLSESEALILWKELHECEQPFTCPHGRPTVIEIKNSELQKRFGRE